MKANQGFTLLELLIGMTLLGFMLALLFGGFRLAANSWDAVAAHTERTADEQLGRAFLRRVLTQMQPLRWKKALNQPIAFTGERGLLRAVAPISGQAGAGGLYVIELALEPAEKEEGPFRLVLRNAPLRYDAEQFADDLADAKSHLILSGLEAAEFSYFGPEKEGDPPHWQDAWINDQRLPQLVRIHLASREAGWGDLLVAPMVAGGGCNWDAIYKRCR